ncbi:MAG TPA: hypothetical protein VF092_20310 [Longimicrobium sp.]
MTYETRDRVQESWAAVLDHAPAAAQAFYDRLIDIDPQLGRHFRGTEMRERERELMRALTALVRNLGEEWRAGGVEAAADPWESAHEMVVCGALFTMLERALGAGFTPALRAAWMEVFSAHAAEIRQAALGDAGSRVVPLHERQRRLVQIGS